MNMVESGKIIFGGVAIAVIAFLAYVYRKPLLDFILGKIAQHKYGNREDGDNQPRLFHGRFIQYTHPKDQGKYVCVVSKETAEDQETLESVAKDLLSREIENDDPLGDVLEVYLGNDRDVTTTFASFLGPNGRFHEDVNDTRRPTVRDLAQFCYKNENAEGDYVLRIINIDGDETKLQTDDALAITN